MNKAFSILALTSLTLSSCSSFGPYKEGERSIAGEGRVFTAVDVTRTAPFVSLKDSVWKNNKEAIGRTSELRPKNIFAMNSFSLSQEKLDQLLVDYKKFFKVNKIDVTINDKATPELIWQVEAFASYVEDMLELKRSRDPYLVLTYINSTKNLLGAFIINHKFVIQKASMFGGGLIEHSVVKGVPVTTIKYKNFIPSDFKKMSAAAPTDSSKPNVLSGMGANKNLFRFQTEASYGVGHRTASLDLVVNAQLGYMDGDDFVHVYGSRYTRVAVEDFMTPDKIDYSMVTTYFGRACDGLAVIYKPTNFFVTFPQMALSKYTTPSGEVRYKMGSNLMEGEFSYSEAELAHTPSLKRSYGDVVNQSCTPEEIQKYGIEERKIHFETGISKEFMDYVTTKSLAYRFNLQRNTFMNEITCPSGGNCSEEVRSKDGVFEKGFMME